VIDTSAMFESRLPVPEPIWVQNLISYG
jgi:hypothetical protein